MLGRAKHFDIPLYVIPNRWDAIAFLLIFGLLALLAEGAQQMHAPMVAMAQEQISLDPANLPHYALRTVLRMFAAIILSLIFTFTYATLAAKSRRARLVLIPILEILQAVPILGFISFTVAFFMGLFPGNIMGAELAAIFAIFTSQAWNMAFSLYQSIRTVPSDLEEAGRSFRFSAWQRFWRLEVPFAAPGLIWNTMMSMSGGWFFVVASEAITVGDITVTLPGIGSYVAAAIAQQDMAAIGYAILTMFLVILAYDQLLFRPLVVWSEKFRFEQSNTQVITSSWVLRLLQQTRLLKMVMLPLSYLWRLGLRTHLPRSAAVTRLREDPHVLRAADFVWYALVAAAVCWGGWRLYAYLSQTLTLADVGTAFELGLYTMLRIIVLIAIASLIWVPVGVWIGFRPKLGGMIQPLAQFLAAFPANLLFPVAVMAIVQWKLEPDIWLSPLLVLGTQWYILFNVIAGAMAFPGDLKQAGANLHMRGWHWWKRGIIPGILPYYVTGAITASGASWNASIVAEYIRWGDTTIAAKGLGAYIAEATAHGDFPRIMLGVAVMSLLVILYNLLLWHRLYHYAETRLRLS